MLKLKAFFEVANEKNTGSLYMKIKFLSLSNLLIFILILIGWWFTATKIEPLLHYHSQNIGFNTSFSFFKSYLQSPGGISNYLAEFVSQFFYFNIWGSLLIVAIASLQSWIALYMVTRLLGKTKLSFLIFAVILLFGVMLFCDYSYPYYVSIKLLFAFTGTWIFYLINDKYPRQSIYSWPVIAVLLLYAASGAALIVFTISTALILIVTRQKKIWISTVPFIFLFAGIVPFLVYKFGLLPSNLMNLYRISEVKPPKMLPYIQNYQVYIYYMLLPVILMAVLFLQQTIKNAPISIVTKGKATPTINFYKRTSFIISSQVILFAVIAYSLFIKSDNPFQRKLLYIEYYADTEQWNKVLEVAETIEMYDSRINYQINRAYAHLGLLPEHLFNYPQLLGSKGLFVDNSLMNSNYTMSSSDLYFDLGYMDESMRWAFEAQTLLPNSPRILKRLVMINIITKNYDLAQMYLNVLGQNMLYQDWVGKYEKYVADHKLADRDPVITEKRLFSPKENAYILDPYENLKLLLKTNKKNRMAYDYLLTLCLLDNRLNEFVKFVQDYPYYHIKKLPRSWEEALSAYIYKTRTVPPFVTSETISKECMQRLKAFDNTLAKYNNDKNAAQDVLRENFENTFWYYLFYLNSGTTNVSN